MAVAKEKERNQQENSMLRLFRETRQELKKVVWPSREETLRLTVLVIVVSSVIGLFLFVGDSIFLYLYSLLLDTVMPTTI
jgi:preprotein translocase subunit SecE